MAGTVISDETGEEFPVQPVEAAVVIASVNTLASDLPQDAAKKIEHAMVAAIELAHAAGVSDPDEIRAHALGARKSVVIALKNEQAAAREEAARNAS